MDNELNEQHWKMTSEVGKYVLPTMSVLPEKLPKMLGAVLSTADGFNVCSLGLDDMEVGKMASLTSSMFAMSHAVLSTLAEQGSGLLQNKKEALLTIGDFQVVIVEVAHPKIDNLILLVAVDKTATGVVFMTVRNVVEELEAKLKMT